MFEQMLREMFLEFVRTNPEFNSMLEEKVESVLKNLDVPTRDDIEITVNNALENHDASENMDFESLVKDVLNGAELTIRV